MKSVCKLILVLMIILACVATVTAEVGDLLISGDSKSLTVKSPWDLKEGYVFIVEDVSKEEDQVLVVLLKNNIKVSSDIMEEGDLFVYEKEIDDREYTIVSMRLADIRNSIRFTSVYQYSDGSNDVASTSTPIPTPTATEQVSAVTTPAQQQKPIVKTYSATSITSNSAVLQGAVNPNGLSTRVTFLPGNSNTRSYFTSTPAQNIGSGTAYRSVSYRLTGLRPSTTYSYYVSATNSAGTQNGAVVTFTTPRSVTTPHSTPHYHTTPAKQASNGNSFWNFLLIISILIGAIIIYKIDFSKA
ncbi:MAG: hypothetical protein AEth_01113 [Candidatus Argoarchaeum ethanivorans]|uniref:Fibronectin type-III domain-containing protein n=1 Tax=Candidatus Argoarchaeum ethanivorans TaxID=2608793 RepID=A0A8B3S160_9EURY|nr:MAG: hypothetical protein AEth_01113 [Candidatus Argoarchaeum ethanivorans]